MRRAVGVYGFVHADPHEGNMMLDTSDDSLVFLDFGLMAEVDGKIMEGFAKGIQSMISAIGINWRWCFRGRFPRGSFSKEIRRSDEKESSVRGMHS